jgi:hypothetical protein
LHGKPSDILNYGTHHFRASLSLLAGPPADAAASIIFTAFMRARRVRGNENILEALLYSF